MDNFTKKLVLSFIGAAVVIVATSYISLRWQIAAAENEAAEKQTQAWITYIEAVRAIENRN